MEDVQTDLAVKAEISLYYDLRLPRDASPKTPLLMAVHGYGAHKRYMMREAVNQQKSKERGVRSRTRMTRIGRMYADKKSVSNGSIRVIRVPITGLLL